MTAPCARDNFRGVLLANPDIDTNMIRLLLVNQFGVDAEPVFVPGAGGDSWCYRAGDWWVSVRRDRQGHVPLSYEAARELRDQGLDFVLAPARGRRGAVVHDVHEHATVVFPLVDGRPLFPDRATTVQAAHVGEMIEVLRSRTVASALPEETFVMPFADELVEGLELASAGADASGPYGERVTALVRANEREIESLRAEMARIEAVCRGEPGSFVLTHGEPNRGNVMLTSDGELLLMDWGTLAWGPPERDAVALADLGLDPPGRREFVRYYELLWILGEVAEYVARFAHPHPGNAEDAEKWAELLLYLSDDPKVAR